MTTASQLERWLHMARFLSLLKWLSLIKNTTSSDALAMEYKRVCPHPAP